MNRRTFFARTAGTLPIVAHLRLTLPAEATHVSPAALFVAPSTTLVRLYSGRMPARCGDALDASCVLLASIPMRFSTHRDGSLHGKSESPGVGVATGDASFFLLVDASSDAVLAQGTCGARDGDLRISAPLSTGCAIDLQFSFTGA